MILGMIGPVQLLILFILPIGLIIGLVMLFTSRAKHKAKAETLESMSNKTPSSNKDTLGQLERLNKLKEAGALRDAEYEIEKRKILG